MPSEHARLSPSSAERWLHCPGSIRLGECFPATTSFWATEGTLAHLMLEDAVKRGFPDAPDPKIAEEISIFYRRHPELGGSFSAMEEDIRAMTDWLEEELAKNRKTAADTQIYSEQRVDLTQWIPDGFGTADVTIARPGYLHIIDLKYGKGVEVEAEENPQLRLYALGVLGMLDLIYAVDYVEMTIFQPRLRHVSTDSVAADDLKKWGYTIVAPTARMALKPDAPFAAGDWCRFCPAKTACRHRAEHFLALSDYLTRHVLSDGELGDALNASTGLNRWATDIKAEAEKRIESGRAVPGWKIVEGRSVRSFSGSESDIISAAEAAGTPRAMLFETQMITLSQMEKVMGKKAFAAAMHDYVVKPPGKPTLVPESDKRPSITAQSAKDAFADEIE